MPRARTIWPEHLNHPDVAPLSDLAYRLWIGLIQVADDEGHARGMLPWIRGSILPGCRQHTNARIEHALLSLAEAGLIVFYEADGERFINIPSWAKWQHPRHPTKSKLPDPARYGNPTVSLPYNARTRGVVVKKDKEGSRGIDSRRDPEPTVHGSPVGSQDNGHGNDQDDDPEQRRQLLRQQLAELVKREAARHAAPE